MSDGISVAEAIKKASQLEPNDADAAITTLLDVMNKTDFYPWGGHTLLHLLQKYGRHAEAKVIFERVNQRHPEFFPSWWIGMVLSRGTDDYIRLCNCIVANIRKFERIADISLATPFVEALLTVRPDDAEEMLERAHAGGILDDVRIANIGKLIAFLDLVRRDLSAIGAVDNPGQWSFGLFPGRPACFKEDDRLFVNISRVGIDRLDGWDKFLAERLSSAVNALMDWISYLHDTGISSWPTASREDRFAAVYWRLLAMPSVVENPKNPIKWVPFKPAAMEREQRGLFLRPGSVELWALWNALWDEREARQAAETVASRALDAAAGNGSYAARDEWPRTSATNNIIRLNTNAGWYGKPGNAGDSFMDWAERYLAALCAGQMLTIVTIDVLPVATLYPPIRNLVPMQWTEGAFLRLLNDGDVVFVTPFADEIRDHFETGRLDALWQDIQIPLRVRSLTTVPAPMSVWPQYPDDSWSVTFQDLCEESARAIEATKANLFIASCGAYGMPLVHEMHRRYGIAGQYWGHVTNLYFGIVTNAGEREHIYARNPDSPNWRRVNLAERFPSIVNIDAGRYAGRPR